MLYRTDDPDRWGVGKGSNLTAAEIDGNVWELAERLVAVEASAGETANGISTITVVGSQMTVFLEDGTALGPYTLPTAMIRYRGDWMAAADYNEMDLITVPDTGVYLVLLDHTAAATFDANAVDADGAPLYRFLFPMGSSGAASLDDLADVDLAALPLDDGDALIYDTATGTWMPGLPTMGLGDLAGVFPGFPDDGDVLTWVAGDVAWRSRPIVKTFLGLTDTPAAFASQRLVTANKAGNALIQPPGISVDEATGYIQSNGGVFRNALVAMIGQSHNDYGMTGLYDRDTLIHADKRATVTVSITGAGTVGAIEKLFDASGDYFQINGTDATTTGFEILIEFAENEPSFSTTILQPYVQTRLSTGAGFVGTWYRSVTVEISPDGATWYRPADGDWETTDFHNDGPSATGVPGLWLATPDGPGIPTPFAYRFIRFTFADRQENAGYQFKDSVWLAEIGLRNLNAPYARQFLSAAGGTIWGALTMAGATGGSQGDGTINATALYDDGTLLCAPVEEVIAGSYDPAVWEALAPNGGLATYEKMKARGFDPGSADSYAAEVEQRRGIPGYWNRAEWGERQSRRLEKLVRRYDPETLEPVMVPVMAEDRVSLAERHERALLALDYAALAIRDLTRRVQTLEARASTNQTT